MSTPPDFSLVQTGRSAPRAYHFRSAPGTRSIFGSGWALATVNDQTGELTICSDWGDWTYRWNTDHLGAFSLTHFIADRSPGSQDYLAQKLSPRSDHAQFSPEKTVAAWREYLIEDRRCGSPRLTREIARQLWDGLGELLHEDDLRDFVDRFYELDNHELVFSDGPSEHLRYEPTSAYLVLLHAIIPALVAACTATVRAIEGEADFWRSG